MKMRIAMFRSQKMFAAFVFLSVAFCLHKTAKAQGASKPNIIFILTDDQGYGDVGAFFQQRRKKQGKPFEVTPNLDEMAAEGARFTQQYCNAPVCAPSRASLLTGVNQGNSHVRDNQFDKALEDNYTMANVLKQAGYETIIIGKYGLQGVKEDGPYWPAHPLKRGFDHFFGYMRHMDGHEHYPAEGLYRGKKEVWNGYELVKGLDKCYTTDLWTAYAKKFITEHQQNSDAPFFMYLAYDAPHAVIELPTQKYPEGKGLKGGLQWTAKPGHMINTASGIIDSYVYPLYASGTWDDDNDPATPEVSWPDTYKRYATAITRIDEGVGDILQLLKDLKIDRNTLVVFTSDNGPSIESYLPKEYVPNHPTFFASYGPFDGIKRDCWEGGLRMPTIASWPAHIPAGRVVNLPSMFSDWLPTFADAAGLAAPVRTNGVSLIPAITGKGEQQPSQVYVEYYEGGRTPGFKEFEPDHRNRLRNQMQMIRIGDMVGVRYNIQSADDDFEIYDVVKDPKEANNIAKMHPDLQKIMKEKVLQNRIANPSAPRPYDSMLVPGIVVQSKMKKGMNWEFYEGRLPWLITVGHKKASAKGAATNCMAPVPVDADGMIVYRGYVKVPADDEYNFSLQSATKAFVRLHGANLLDLDYGFTPGTIITRNVFLKKGWHPVTIYKMYNGRNTDCRFLWKNMKETQWRSVDSNMFTRN